MSSAQAYGSAPWEGALAVAKECPGTRFKARAPQAQRFPATSKEVADRARTGDRLGHNQELYQLSYSHHAALNLPGRAG
jgi:hypothetical protein